MPTAWRPRPLSRAESSPLQHLPAGLTIASATLVLFARTVSIPSLERVLCAFGPMKASAAVCFLLAGVSLALSRRAATRRASAVVGAACGVVIALFATLTTAESLTTTDWGIDRLLYFRPLDCDADSRMPPITLVAFVLLGLALALRHAGRARQTSDVLAFATALLASIPLLGVLYGATAAFAGGRFAAMTPSAAASFLLLCAGFFLSYPELRQSSPLHSSNPEPAALRRLLLATFLWPTIGGWALVSGVRIGLYDLPLGAAILVTLGFAVFTVLILRNARDVDVVRRTRAEAESRFRDLVELSPDGILTVDRNGLIRTANERAEELFGRSRTELVGQSIETLLPAGSRAQHAADRTAFQIHPHVRPMAEGRQLVALHKDGREFPVEVSLSPLQSQGEQLVIATVRDVTERREAERALRRSEEKYRMVVESASEIFYQVSVSDDPLRGRVEFVSPQCEAVTGRRPQEFMADPNLWVESVHPDDRLSLFESTRSILTSRKVDTRYYRIRDRVGGYHSMADRVVPLVDAEGHVNGYQGTARDITERIRADEQHQRLENQLNQARKMEAVGQLAGGVAHDFNNLLTAMSGFTELVLLTLDETDSRRADLLEVRKATVRAATLTRQLLAFSRRQMLRPQVLDVNALIGVIATLLRRTIREDIELAMALQSVEPVRVDPSQLEQVLLNLALNAQDAMPKGGRLHVVTETVAVDEAWARRYPPMTPGRYVHVTVRDTGVGMTPETQARIFEPFFTTKAPGKGTGLGLATVYGIIKQSGGFIWVDSPPGQGTSFDIYLPAVDAVVEPIVSVVTAGPDRDGSETILVAEDDGAVRRLAKHTLSDHGYTVLEGRDGEDALAIAHQQRAVIHLLITDVVMPGLSGPDLAAHLRKEWPAMRVLYTSGYGENITTRTGVEHGVPVLGKPFLPMDLLREVREVLDTPHATVVQ